MKTEISPLPGELLHSPHYSPAVSIILSFEPRINATAELRHDIKIAVDEAERRLNADYSPIFADPVIHRLHTLIQNLDYNTHKKSIAIFASPAFEKIIYLDYPVKQKIVIGDSFQVRDLLLFFKRNRDYILLCLSGKQNTLYLGVSSGLQPIKPNNSLSIHAITDDPPQRVANFTDLQQRKSLLQKKLLRRTDHELDTVLKAFPLPLFLAGSKKIMGTFREITKHEKHIAANIHGNYEDATIPELRNLVAPYVQNWYNDQDKWLVTQLSLAADNGNLISGIQDVWREANSPQTRLLAVEEDFNYPATTGESADIIYPAVAKYNTNHYIPDAVDDLIEKVLEHGGEVTFTGNGVLKEYGGIALIKYWH